MIEYASHSLNPVFIPIDLKTQPLLGQAAAVMLGTALLALSASIEIPMGLVPITMQSFAVPLIGALYGSRLGTMTVIVWLMEGAAGMPVLAGGGAGIQHFVGPTAGYLFAFPSAAALSGWLVERSCKSRHLIFLFMTMLLGNATCLIFGSAWLATLIGARKAIVLGVLPFLTGALLKSILAAAVLKLLSRDTMRVK